MTASANTGGSAPTRPRPAKASHPTPRPPIKSTFRKKAVQTPTGAPKSIDAQWFKPAPFALPSDATLDDAIGHVASACRDHWHANLAAAITGEHPEGIHQIRVGLRRFRAFLSLCKAHIPGDQLARLRAEAKRLSDALGLARDLDVFLTEITEPLASRSVHDADIAVLLRTAREARDKAYGDAAAALRSHQYRRFMTRLNTWIAGQGWREEDADRRNMTAADFARHVLNERLVKVRDRAKSLKGLTPNKLHRLRISIKKLRYGLEFSARHCRPAGQHASPAFSRASRTHWDM